MSSMNCIMIGDVVGEPGLEALEKQLPLLIQKYNAEFVIVNGENAADGFGLTEETFNRIINAGADIVTSGNHIWEKREFMSVLNSQDNILRPANYPAGSAGKGFIRVTKGGTDFLVVNLQGRECMYNIDCPFTVLNTILSDEKNSGAAVIIDFHAEAPFEKEALGFYTDGRAALVAGTHTHVQTGDERILPGGTAYITDIGMTGVIESIIGMDIGICLNRVKTQILYRMECAKGLTAVRGVCITIDTETKKALSIERINETVEPDSETQPVSRAASM